MNEGINAFQALEIIEINEMNARRNFLSDAEIAEIRSASNRTSAENIGREIYFRRQENSFAETYEEYMAGVRTQIDDIISDTFVFSLN